MAVYFQKKTSLYIGHVWFVSPDIFLIKWCSATNYLRHMRLWWREWCHDNEESIRKESPHLWHQRFSLHSAYIWYFRRSLHSIIFRKFQKTMFRPCMTAHLPHSLHCRIYSSWCPFSWFRTGILNFSSDILFIIFLIPEIRQAYS